MSRRELGFSVALVVLALGTPACSSHATVDLRDGGWVLPCLAPNAICSAGATSLGDGGPAIDASFAAPIAVALDTTGNLFIADDEDNLIRRIDAVSGDVSTVVGDGLFGSPNVGDVATQTHLGRPTSVAACPDGSIVFLEAGGDEAIYGVDPQGPATAAELEGVRSLAVTPDGVVWVTEHGHRVRRIQPGGLP